MRWFHFRLAAFALCASLAAFAAAPALRAQDEPPQYGQGRGQGRGMGGGMFMGGNSAHGTVTAVSGSNITIKDEQGQVYTVETGPNTHIRKNREEAKISDIHPGDVIIAAGNLDEQAKTVGAMFVIVLDPQQAARMEEMRATFGKTWTAGRVTAIKDLTLTIERPDKVTQTIAVDENTVFRKGGRGNAEDITFPEIKVGDMVRATGAVQAGNFLATNLVVAEPGQHRPGRYGQGQGEGPGGSPDSAPPATPPAQPQSNPQF